jgi:hypothetical protein
MLRSDVCLAACLDLTMCCVCPLLVARTWRDDVRGCARTGRACTGWPSSSLPLLLSAHHPSSLLLLLCAHHPWFPHAHHPSSTRPRLAGHTLAGRLRSLLPQLRRGDGRVLPRLRAHLARARLHLTACVPRARARVRGPAYHTCHLGHCGGALTRSLARQHNARRRTTRGGAQRAHTRAATYTAHDTW